MLGEEAFCFRSFVTITDTTWKKTLVHVEENPVMRGSIPDLAWYDPRWCGFGNPGVCFKIHPVNGFAFRLASSILL